MPFEAPKWVMRVAYPTLCRSLLEYVCVVWDLHLQQQISLLEGVQSKALQFILVLEIDTHSITEGRVSLEIDCNNFMFFFACTCTFKCFETLKIDFEDMMKKRKTVAVVSLQIKQILWR